MPPDALNELKVCPKKTNKQTTKPPKPKSQPSEKPVASYFQSLLANCMGNLSYSCIWNWSCCWVVLPWSSGYWGVCCFWFGWLVDLVYFYFSCMGFSTLGFSTFSYQCLLFNLRAANSAHINSENMSQDCIGLWGKRKKCLPGLFLDYHTQW